MSDRSPPEYKECFDIENQSITVRTMHPEDREIEDAFVKSLSDESRYYRFHGAMRQLSPYMLERFTHPEYPAEMALIATISCAGAEKQIGVVRYAKTDESDRAEVAIAVADEWQGKGLGTHMMLALRDIARDAGIHELEVNILRENERMLGLARHLGYLAETKGNPSASVILGKGIDPEKKP